MQQVAMFATLWFLAAGWTFATLVLSSVLTFGVGLPYWTAVLCASGVTTLPLTASIWCYRTYVAGGVVYPSFP